jgi:hypothetical protein
MVLLVFLVLFVTERKYYFYKKTLFFSGGGGEMTRWGDLWQTYATIGQSYLILLFRLNEGGQYNNKNFVFFLLVGWGV